MYLVENNDIFFWKKLGKTPVQHDWNVACTYLRVYNYRTGFVIGEPSLVRQNVIRRSY